ncbi:MAG: LuxR C-terminal-related transcriptional regulator [Pseudomonadota bacterium]
MPMLVDFLFRTVDGAFAVDSTQRIVFWNPACEQLLKRPARLALGRRCCEVLQGCNAAGEAVCQPDCAVARLARGGASPESFPLWVDDGHGAKQCVAANIVLMPSPSKNEWTVVHLLHRGKALATLDMLQGAVQRGQRPAGGNGEDTARMPAADATGLTTREDEVIRLLAEGLPVRAISARLYISPVTVRNHLQHIMAKLDLHSQRETVAYAYRHNLF